ncbi:MAG: hypothetical protein COB30_007640 [Ectothiorhodospiraceae bacterium]|nr:hypothetical protein [Ectothiorhodospiraceae bacterium]
MKTFTALLVVVLASLALGVVSFDSDRTIIEDVVLVREAEQKLLQLEFSAPVRVVGQYPQRSGKILQVKLSVIALGRFDENVSLLEEFVGIEEGKEIYMTHMQYEGNVPGGPFLVMKFNRPVQWQVTEGDSLMSMDIIIKKV